MSGWGDCDIAQAERVRAVMDGNHSQKLPYGGRACSCPHGTASEACCVQQLGLAMRPLLLDVFCGAGGASTGYNWAGFDVVGIAAEARGAMGIDWMNRHELAEAIPPAYTEYIGRRLLEDLEVAA